ncbi:MAG TPA: hypothetical protein PKC18_07525, partial [Lacipirellulaceae bacterium]|nr:hypothetical protein [Lacipirellulaceae bacterium]
TFQGTDLLVRCLACGLVYALAWGVYWYVGSQLFGADDYAANKLELFHVGILAAIALGIGTFTAFVAFELEPITAFFHFALYFGVTVLLRATMGLSLLPGIQGGGS